MTARPRLIAILIGLTAVAVAASPDAGHAASPAVPGFHGSRRATPARYGNVGRTHSPELLRLLAGHRAAAPDAAASAAPGLAEGVDVASFQHANGAAIDWPQVAADGYKFAFIKATEGSYYVNPYFASDYAAAKAAGLAVAAYHFGNPSNSGGTLQADFVANTAQYAADGKTLPVVLDMEYDPYAAQDHTNECYGLTTAAMVSWLRAFSAELARRTGQPPIIYTTADWWDKCTGSSTAFSGDQLWIASWNVTSPVLPAGWANWQFWQYTSTASVPGITGHTDVSYLSDAMLDLLAPGIQSGAVGTPARLAITVLGSDPSQDISYGAAGLPSGVTISSATGVVSGTWPATPATGTATITATSASGPTGTTSYRWYAHGPVKLTNPGSLTSTSLGPADLQIEATDGRPGCTLTFAAAGLPPGLSMTSCGKITGWITRAGGYQVTVRVTDAGARTLATVTFRWTVRPAPSGGPTEPLPLAGTTKCLRGQPGGTAVTVRPCDNRADQAWTVTATSTLRNGGKCLDDPGPAGTAVVLAACDGAAAQRWQDIPGSGLLNPGTGRCLDDPAGSGLSAPVQATACAESAGQRWILPRVPLTSGVPGYCAAVRPAVSRAWPGVALQRCRATAAQTWSVEPGGTLVADGKCLSTLGAIAADSKLGVATCDGAASQQWQLLGSPLGAQFVNPAASLCAAKPATTPAPAALVLEPCTDTPATTWHVN